MRRQSLELQLFEPSRDAIYTFEAAARMANVPRHAILVIASISFCNAQRAPSRTVTILAGMPFVVCVESKPCEICGKNFAGIRVILELTATLERMQSEIASLKRERSATNGAK
jgi:hypothetical protein